MNSMTGNDNDLSIQSARWLDVFRDEPPGTIEERKEFLAWAAKSESATSEVITDMALDDLIREARPRGTQTREERIAHARAALARGESLEGDRTAAPQDVRRSQDAHDSQRARDSQYARDSQRALDSQEPAGVEGFAGARPGGYAVDQSSMGGRLAVAATIVIGVVLAAYLAVRQPATWKPYTATATAAAELKLGDDSIVRLSASTRIETHFTDIERTVRMKGGEAEFRVSHDARRPFTVNTPHGSVVARGTVFKVTVGDERVDVDVLEGRVGLSGEKRGSVTKDLTEGQHGSLLAGGTVETPGDAGRAPAAAAEAGDSTRAFQLATLQEIVDAFNKRSGRVAFEIRGSACSRLIGTVVNLDDPQSLVNRVSALEGLKIEHRGDVTVIRSSDSAGEGGAVCGRAR